MGVRRFIGLTLAWDNRGEMKAIDYDAWAKTYDETRGTSPSVLGPIAEALGKPAGRSLLDIGGGTGNFARLLAEAGLLGRRRHRRFAADGHDDAQHQHPDHEEDHRHEND